MLGFLDVFVLSLWSFFDIPQNFENLLYVVIVPLLFVGVVRITREVIRI